MLEAVRELPEDERVEVERRFGEWDGLKAFRDRFCAEAYEQRKKAKMAEASEIVLEPDFGAAKFVPSKFVSDLFLA